MFTTVRVTVGRIVLVGGVLTLLFIPYLLWGTGLQTARSQDRLRQQFETTQHALGAHLGVHHLTPQHTPGPVTVAPPLPDPPLGSAVGLIDIPKINVSMVVIEGTGTSQLQAGPGHYPGTPLPGQAGNVAIAGHRTTYLHPFYNLDLLAPGDAIVLETAQGLFLYHVISSTAVSPTDVAVVAPTPTPTLTLTTCNPRYSASQRLVVHAGLVASALAGHTATAGSNAATAAVVRRQAAVVAGEPDHDWARAVLWGLAVAAVTVAAWWGAARLRGGRRALVAGVGLVVWVVVVFYFFGAVAPLLPASF
ncbi:MAG: class E sortase [Acidimicrobiales bacterium]|nr:class E sortase [Acidimicrobiales bacterium]